jgi:hypothetical protein
MTLRLKPWALKLLKSFKREKNVDEQERHERLELISSNEELRELAKQLQPTVKNPF